MVALNFADFVPLANNPGDPQQAFRAGILGRSEPLTPFRGLDEDRAAYSTGPCVQVMFELQRLPGLDHWRAAFETGRAMWAIGRLLDQARAPQSVARQFRDNVAGAVMTHRMRKIKRSWGAEDTVGMFMELYDRVLGEDDLKADLVRRRILDQARGKN